MARKMGENGKTCFQQINDFGQISVNIKNSTIVITYSTYEWQSMELQLENS
jgi:hypothetical protein